jgi:predicted O-methyltransferase YrrM
VTSYAGRWTPRPNLALRLRTWFARRLDPFPRLKTLLLVAGTRRRVFVDFPVPRRPRYGHGRPPHPELQALLAARRAEYAELLGEMLALRPYFARIPREPDPERPRDPAWNQRFLPPIDAMALATILRREDPSTYVEIGSGNSTRFARRAIDDHGLRTRIVSIDPAPRAEIDSLCDEVVRGRLERTDQGIFNQLGAGDVVFMDGSHRLFVDSDATVFFMEVLPRLAPGVLVHVHDVFLPSDYPADWDTFFGEQYVLAAFLLAGGPRLEVVLPNYFISTDPELSTLIAPLWDERALAGLSRQGGSFWVRIR